MEQEYQRRLFCEPVQLSDRRLWKPHLNWSIITGFEMGVGTGDLFRGFYLIQDTKTNTQHIGIYVPKNCFFNSLEIYENNYTPREDVKIEWFDCAYFWQHDESTFTTHQTKMISVLGDIIDESDTHILTHIKSWGNYDIKRRHNNGKGFPFLSLPKSYIISLNGVFGQKKQALPDLDDLITEHRINPSRIFSEGLSKEQVDEFQISGIHIKKYSKSPTGFWALVFSYAYNRFEFVYTKSLHLALDKNALFVDNSLTRNIFD